MSHSQHESEADVPHLVGVHPEELKVDSGHGLNETLVAGGQLELPEETSAHAAGGGAAETNLGANKMVKF